MLTGGHIAASYLISQAAKSFEVSLTNNEILAIIIAGNIPDVDFLIGFVTGKTGEAHHQNITHTPVGIFLIWLTIIFVFKTSFILSLLLLIALLIHLVLDDIGFWAYQLKLMTTPVYPQINWFYPLTKFHKNKLMRSNKRVLKYYFFNTRPVFLTEVSLILVALMVFLWSSYI